jgi:hypothetical protein
MATESPLLVHTQCTASANLSATASLSGGNGSGQYLCMKISGSRTVTVAAANTDVVTGILQNDPLSGQAANVGWSGITKAVAGAAITAGAGLMSDTSGRVITWTTAGTNPCLGQCLETATGAGQIVTILVSPNAAIQ